MPQKYKHLFFDLDHTLWDFDHNSELTLKQLFEEYQLKEKGIEDFQIFLEVYKGHNDRMWERFRKGFIKREELRWKRVWLTLLDFKIADTVLANEMSVAYLEILPTQKQLNPYALEVLQHCSNQYNLHLITNGFEVTQWQKLQYSGISGFFQHVITSEKSNSMKPHAEIFDYALATTSALKEESIMIGDALEIDVAGAMTAGWDQVFYNPSEQKHNRKPTFEIKCLSELMQIF